MTEMSYILILSHTHLLQHTHTQTPPPHTHSPSKTHMHSTHTHPTLTTPNTHTTPKLTFCNTHTSHTGWVPVQARGTDHGPGSVLRAIHQTESKYKPYVHSSMYLPFVPMMSRYFQFLWEVLTVRSCEHVKRIECERFMTKYFTILFSLKYDRYKMIL